MYLNLKLISKCCILFSFAAVGLNQVAGQTTMPTFEKSALVWVDREGREELLPLEPQSFGPLEISPDGEYMATHITEAGIRDLWTYHFESGEFKKITTTGKAGFPTWTPDGERLIYASWGEGLWQVLADGSGPPTMLTEPVNSVHAPNTFSPDGKLVYVDIIGSDIDLHMFSFEDSRASVPLLKTKFDELAAAISPNGRWIAYTSSISGQWEIHVSQFPSMERSWQISTNGGQDPRWSRNGRELFFESLGNIFSASVNTEAEFEHGNSEELFGGNYQFLPLRSYDIASDNERILMSRLISP